MATRISPRYLEALEKEQWANLPGGVFNRGFIRAVARFLGLDEDDVLAEYDSVMNGQNSTVDPHVATAGLETPEKRRSGWLVLVGGLSLLLLLIIGWQGWVWRHRTVPPIANEIASTPLQANAVATAPTPSDHNISASPPSGSIESVPSAPQSLPLRLKIEAGKETSVTVSTDGSKVFEGSMIAGQSRTFIAQEAIDISAKDAGALLLELNGQTLAPLGPPGQPGSTTLTRADLRRAPGGAD